MNRLVGRRDGQNEWVDHRHLVVAVVVGKDRADNDKVTASVAWQRRPLDGNKDRSKRQLLRPLTLAVLEVVPETWVRKSNRIRWHLRTSFSN